MSLVAAIDRLFAESGDAAHHALRHLAGEIEKLKAGGLPAGVPLPDVAVLVDGLKQEIGAKVDAMLEQVKAELEVKATAFVDTWQAQVNSKLAELEADVVAAIAKLHPVQAGSAGAPAPQPEPSQQQAPQGGNPT